MTRFCPSHTHTYTHLFPFPLRQLCQPLISTCVGHKMAKGQLKASLSWLTGSQFVSYKHRTHLNTSVFTYPSFPPSYLPVRSDPGYYTTFIRKSKSDNRILQVVLVFRLLGDFFFVEKVKLDIEASSFCLPTCLEPGFPSIVMTTVCTHRHELFKTMRGAAC